jgi:sugar-phosphatase
MVELSCDGVLFDLDGVLVDSTPAVERVWSKWAIEHNLDPEETVRIAHGRPSIATVRDILPDADYEAENEIILKGELEDTEGIVALPGARELLESLPPDRWALVTSCARPLADARLKTAGLPIPTKKITCDDITHGKPDPEPYLKGAALLGVPASRCIVFEDAPAGIRAGKAAGSIVIALRTTSSDPELKEAGADWIITGYSELNVGVATNGSGALKLTIKEG